MSYPEGYIPVYTSTLYSPADPFVYNQNEVINIPIEEKVESVKLTNYIPAIIILFVLALLLFGSTYTVFRHTNTTI